MVLAYSLDQEEMIQNIFLTILYLVRFLRIEAIYRALLRSYNITSIGKMVNLQPCFVGLGLVVRE